MKYRKRPVVIDAWSCRELMADAKNDPTELLPEAVLEAMSKGGWVFTDEFISIPTLEGRHRVGINDMVIRGIAGEFYGCKSDIFFKTYEVEDGV